MKTARLKMLGLEVPLSYFTEFHDDGFVQNIEQHYLSLTQRYYGFPAEALPQETEGINPVGMCTTWRPRLRRHIHIYYLDWGSEAPNVHVRAHEETHALCRLGKLNMLEWVLERDQQVRLPLTQIKKRYGEQVVAELGAIYARGERMLLNEPEGQAGEDQPLSSTCQEYLQAVALYNEASPIWKIEVTPRVKERRA